MKINAQKKVFSFQEMLRWKCPELPKNTFLEMFIQIFAIGKNKSDKSRASKNIDKITMNIFFI